MDNEDEYEGDEVYEERWADDSDYDEDFTYHHEDTRDGDGVARKVRSPPPARCVQSAVRRVAAHGAGGGADLLAEGVRDLAVEEGAVEKEQGPGRRKLWLPLVHASESMRPIQQQLLLMACPPWLSQHARRSYQLRRSRSA